MHSNPRQTPRLVASALLLCACASASWSGSPPPAVDWQKIRNPVYARAGWSVKDAAMVIRGETIYLLLFYATSRDLERWDAHQPLARNLTRGKRAIDGALAWHKGVTFLVWKEDQTPQLAVARSFDASTWERLGSPSGGWFENAQLLPIDNVWHLLATGEGHRPFVARLSADPNRPRDWLRWNAPTELKVPRESFNTHDVANAAFLADWRALDGYFYLLYAGNTEGESHAGRGDNRLGLARSKDLQQWRVPPIE